MSEASRLIHRMNAPGRHFVSAGYHPQCMRYSI